MVRLAGVKAIRYTGSEPKKLWEVGGRNVPILNRGDVVLVGMSVAISLCRSRFFEPCDVEISANVESLSEPCDVEISANVESLSEPMVINGIDVEEAFEAPQSHEAGNVTLAEAESEEVDTPARKKGK